ncbi:MAG: hypothetical protein ACK412_07455 [Chloroherpetonaceae bacterium]
MRVLFLSIFLLSATTLHGQSFTANQLRVPKFYPAQITFDSTAFQSFLASYQAFKEKYQFIYLREILDSVGCTINQLVYAANPIVLNYKPHLKNRDTTAAMLIAIRQFIDEHAALFHTYSNQIILNSIVEENGYRSILFECSDYRNGYRVGGKTKGKIEFVVGKNGEIIVLASTSIRKGTLPIDTVRFSSNQVTKSLLYRRFNVDLGEKSFSYLVDKIDVIKVKRVCVYEVRDYEDIENEFGEVIERRLRLSEVHIAYEVEIDIGYKKPIVRLYIDGFTGEELGIEYPFLEDS